MKRVRAALAVLSLAATASCERELPPKGQFVIFVDTDAVVPAARGEKTDPLALAPLVDRARFEVSSDGKPVPNSSRDVALDATMLRERGLSFGVVAPPDARAVTVRIRLFRADRVTGAEPEAGVTLDTTVTLPPAPADGIAELDVLLKTDDMGLAVGPIGVAPGHSPSSVVGSWRGGKRAPCSETAQPGETCIPGASFFFGDPALRGRSVVSDIYQERLVWISPFFLDTKEVTVGEFRARWSDLQTRGLVEPVAKSVDEYCTWTPAPDGDNDSRALNCVSWPTAIAYCEALGKTLPTEAQFELVQSGLGEEWGFPWGTDEPDCDGAVWGCGGIDTAKSDTVKFGAGQCRAARVVPGPFALGRGQIDKLGSSILHNGGGDDVVDLGGNLSEWSRDVWARPTDAYWSSVRPMIDPLNTLPNALDGDAHTLRGGDWASTVQLTRGGVRRRRDTTDPGPITGFRCARPATAK